jgi:hypothetical protein
MSIASARNYPQINFKNSTLAEKLKTAHVRTDDRVNLLPNRELRTAAKTGLIVILENGSCRNILGLRQPPDSLTIPRMVGDNPDSVQICAGGCAIHCGRQERS